MTLTKDKLLSLKEAIANKRQLGYDRKCSIHYIPLTKEQNQTFEYIYNTHDNESFSKMIPYDKAEVLIFGNVAIDHIRYDSDSSYSESINTYLDQAIPSIYNEDLHKKMYACFCTFRTTKGVEYFEPTLFSSWKCLIIALGNPECVLCVRVKH